MTRNLLLLIIMLTTCCASGVAKNDNTNDEEVVNSKIRKELCEKYKGEIYDDGKSYVEGNPFLQKVTVASIKDENGLYCYIAFMRVEDTDIQVVSGTYNGKDITEKGSYYVVCGESSLSHLWKINDKIYLVIWGQMFVRKITIGFLNGDPVVNKAEYWHIVNGYENGQYLEKMTYDKAAEDLIGDLSFDCLNSFENDNVWDPSRADVKYDYDTGYDMLKGSPLEKKYKKVMEQCTEAYQKSMAETKQNINKIRPLIEIYRDKCSNYTKELSKLTKEEATEKYKRDVLGPRRNELFPYDFTDLGKELDRIGYIESSMMVWEPNNDLNTHLRPIYNYLKENGIIIRDQCGSYYTHQEPNFDYEMFKKYVTDEYRDFLEYESIEKSNRFYCYEVSFPANLLADRIYQWHSFIKNYPHSELRERAFSKLMDYMNLLLFGKIDIALVFNPETNEIEKPQLEAITTLASERSNDKTLCDAIHYYLGKLKVYNYKYSEELEDDVTSYIKKIYSK